MRAHSPTALKMLSAMARYPDLSRNIAKALLMTNGGVVTRAGRSLVAAKLAEPAPGHAWRITPAGRAALGVQ